MIKAVVLDLDRTVFSRQRYNGHLHNACANIYGADAEKTTLHGRNLVLENLGWNSKEIINDFLAEINGTPPSAHYAALFNMLRILEQRGIPFYYCSSTLYPGAAELLLEAIHQQAGITHFRKQTVEDIKAHGIQPGGLVTLRDSLSLNPNEWGDVDPNTNDKYKLLNQTGHIKIDKHDLLLLDDSDKNCKKWEEEIETPNWLCGSTIKPGGITIKFTGPADFNSVLASLSTRKDAPERTAEDEPLLEIDTQVNNEHCCSGCLSRLVASLWWK